MTRRRLFSSGDIITALKRGGFELARKSKKSHQALKRLRPDGRHDVTVVPMGKKEVPKGTFDSILKQANVDLEEFLDWARVRRKGRKASNREPA